MYIMPTVKELKALAKSNNIKGYSSLRKADLVSLLRDNGISVGSPKRQSKKPARKPARKPTKKPAGNSDSSMFDLIKSVSDQKDWEIVKRMADDKFRCSSSASKSELIESGANYICNKIFGKDYVEYKHSFIIDDLYRTRDLVMKENNYEGPNAVIAYDVGRYPYAVRLVLPVLRKLVLRELDGYGIRTETSMISDDSANIVVITLSLFDEFAALIARHYK